MREKTVLLVCAAVMVAASLSAQTHFVVQPKLQWQSTGVTVTAGQNLKITADGIICTSGCYDAAMHNPTGCCPSVPGHCDDWGSDPADIAGSGYLVPGVNRYSLVGRIGGGSPFYVGTDLDVTSTTSGNLELAFNDDWYSDNSGSFDVYIAVGSGCDGITIPANQHWTGTGLNVTEGEALTITATGEWSMGVGGWVDADGEPKIAPYGSDYPCDGVPVGALIGKIGHDGSTFLVGSSLLNKRIPRTGELFLGPNEGNVWWGNEQGSLCAVTTVDDQMQNTAPMVTILRPASYSPYYSGEPIDFLADVFDVQEGYLPPSDLKWYSDQNGYLGQGYNLVYSGLSVGTHVITVEATDADELTGSDEIELFVTATTMPTYVDIDVVDIKLTPSAHDDDVSPIVFVQTDIELTLRNHGNLPAEKGVAYIETYQAGMFHMNTLGFDISESIPPGEERTVLLTCVFTYTTTSIMKVTASFEKDNNRSNNSEYFDIDPEPHGHVDVMCLLGVLPVLGHHFLPHGSDLQRFATCFTKKWYSLAHVVQAIEDGDDWAVWFNLGKVMYYNSLCCIGCAATTLLYPLHIHSVGWECGMWASDVVSEIRDAFWSAFVGKGMLPMHVTSLSPVDLYLIDPYGFVTSPDTCGIPGSMYAEVPYGDDTSDNIMVPYPVPGEYRVAIVPEEGADENAYVTVMAKIGLSESITILDSVTVGDLPGNWILLSNETPNGSVVIHPDTMSVKDANVAFPVTAHIYLGNFTDGHEASDVDPASLMINGSIAPSGTTVLPSFPGFVGEVLEIEFPQHLFVAGYGTLWGITDQVYTVDGHFTGRPAGFTLEGTVTMRGLLPGDVNNDGNVDVADLVYFVDYSFNGGPAPVTMELADLNASGTVDIADIIYLVEYMFMGGPAPLNPR